MVAFSHAVFLSDVIVHTHVHTFTYHAHIHVIIPHIHTHMDACTHTLN